MSAILNFLLHIIRLSYVLCTFGYIYRHSKTLLFVAKLFCVRKKSQMIKSLSRGKKTYFFLGCYQETDEYEPSK